jgi:acyl-CoA thioester hydrolase
MFVYKRKVHYHETDQMGVMHHSNYFKWMEEARVAFMDGAGFGYARLESEGVVSPVTAIEAQFKRPLLFDDAAEVRLKVARYTGVVLEIEYEFVKGGERCATARSEHCFLKQGRPVVLKRAVPELDQAMRAASQE